MRHRTPLALLDRYYPPGHPAREPMLRHGRQVARKAEAIARALAHLNPDLDFIREAAWLHDIGAFYTKAPMIGCSGQAPYIRHGVLGADLLRAEGLARHALVCERHVGAGLSRQEIISRNLPLPNRDMAPVSLEEKIICYADKFFSKTGDGAEKSVAEARWNVARHGPEQGRRFDMMRERFDNKI